MMRANHDCQFLFTKNHALSVIHYVMKYISKPEDSLHFKLAIAAAVRKNISAVNIDPSTDLDVGKSMLIKTYNKLNSHREVGLPEIISHLLDFPDHYTGATFRKVHTTQLLKYVTLAYRCDSPASHHETSCTEGSDDITPTHSQCKDELQSEIVTSQGQLALLSKFDDYA